MNHVGCECEGQVLVQVNMCWNVHSGGAGPGPAQAARCLSSASMGLLWVCQPLPTHGGVHKGLEIEL